jgi:uncharacterized protein YjiS (DUF1127 family)
MNLSNDTYPISGGQAKIAGDVGTWLSSAFARLHKLGAWWAERRAKHNEMQELYAFSDRELWDVGLSRSDLMAIEKGTYRKD